MAALIPAVASLAAAAAPTVVRVVRKRQKRPRKVVQAAKPKTSRRVSLPRELRPQTRGELNGFGSRRTDPVSLAIFRRMADEALGPLVQPGGIFARAGRTRNSLSFDHAHLAQRDVEKSFRNGIRVIVTNADGPSSASFSIAAQGSVAGASTAPFPFTSSTTQSVFALTPSNVDDKLKLLEEIFEFNACRYLKVRHNPVVGDYTTTSVNTNAMLALGILKDADAAGTGGTYAGSSVTFKQVCDLETFFSTHVSKPAELEYSHSGTELWRSSNKNISGNIDDNLNFQAYVIGKYDTGLVSGNTSNATYGHTAIFAVWDFYGIKAIDSSVDVRRKLAAPSRTDSKEDILPPMLRVRAASPTPSLSEDHFSDVKEKEVDKGKLGGVGRGTRNVSELSRLVSAPLAIPKKEKGST